MNQFSRSLVGGIIVFVLGLAIGFTIRPTPVCDVSPLRPSGSNSRNVMFVDDKDQTELSKRIEDLQHTVKELRSKNTELSDSLHAQETAESDPAHTFGLSSEYVKDLPYEGLSQNLIVTTEGQVANGITRDQAAMLNSGLQLILENFRAWEKEHAIVESETENELVIMIPPQNSPDTRRKIQNLFVSILGEDEGQTFFRENSITMMRSLSGYGEYSRIVTVSKSPDSSVSISDAIIKSDGSAPFSSSTGVSPGRDVPPALRHLLELANE